MFPLRTGCRKKVLGERCCCCFNTYVDDRFARLPINRRSRPIKISYRTVADVASNCYPSVRGRPKYEIVFDYVNGVGRGGVWKDGPRTMSFA